MIHYDITMGNDIARDIHCNVTMSNHAISMRNDIPMSFFYYVNYTRTYDIADSPVKSLK